MPQLKLSSAAGIRSNCRMPGMPSEYSSLLSWERAWEKAFASTYGTAGGDPSRHWRAFRLSSEILVVHILQPLFDNNPRFAVFELAALDIDLLDAFARRDFERQWKAYTHLERQDIILQGLSRSMELLGPNFSFAGMDRLWCPEASLKHLADRDGEGFLELAKSLLPSDIDAPTIKTVRVHHPIIDRMLAATMNDSQVTTADMWERYVYGARSSYLVGLVKAILGVVRAEAPQQVVTCTTRRFRRAFSEYTSSSGPRNIPGNPLLTILLKGIETATTETECAFCLKRKDALPAHHAYKRCAGCAKADREVLYCSRECQISDWKEGNHKEFCGLTEWELYDAEKRSAELPPAPWIPKAAPGFRRSPALLYQLVTLRRDRGMDYVIFDAEPGNDITVRMNGETEPARAARIQFLVLRNRAFRNADPAAVPALFALLCEHLQAAIGYDAEHAQRVRKLRRQLKLEYGVDVGEEPMPLSAVPEPTLQEVEELLRLEGGPVGV